jgi:hypothetical protein
LFGFVGGGKSDGFEEAAGAVFVYNRFSKMMMSKKEG